MTYSKITIEQCLHLSLMAEFLRHAANVAHAGGAAGALEILQWFRLALGIGIGEVQLRVVHRALLKAQF